ncbi:MAG: D-glycero-beta-D-manno-heptose-7-phosphate kinase [Gammaproteobacteria bacterium]|nr:D-glycero-beta-D-manno-heptose-7-phosphate kinase [Gammaproteobacteria bacterium]MDA7971419.1 D-glycero-beta-D-manno-heptose-7-phosphate kinase [Gammaproteobacteria bacterium]MDA8021907.1 D-glycero-beta-D-manno-heptose-7-phosphate kinase [Gammaproteobacteria bacterium]
MTSRLEKQLGKLPQCRILVAGDAMLDRYWFGRVERISPEAPVPVVGVERSDERLGGAGNVACNVTSLGASCTLLALTGDDEAGRHLAEIAGRAGIARELVAERGAQTTLKLRVISQNQQLLRADFETPPGAGALAEAHAKFAELLDAHQVAVLSDYGKGCLSGIEKLIAQARAKNIPVLVDPKGGNFSRYRGATMVTPNLKEFEEAAGAVADDADMRRKAEELMRRHELEKLLVTLSERGMVLFARGGGELRGEARAREVYDVSGAGDSVIAVMALALAAGLEDADALAIANSAAGVVVSKLGTAAADAGELAAALRRDHPQ